MSTADRARGIPKDIDAETGVLGSILLQPDAIDDVAAIINADDFFDQSNAILFAHIQSLHNQNKVPDTRLLVKSLKKAGELEEGTVLDDAGGISYLETLFERVPTAHNAIYYARSVKEAATLRGLIITCERTAAAAYEVDADAQALLTETEEGISRIAENGREQTEAHSGDILAQAIARLPMPGQQAAPIGISTGYIDLDKMLGGLAPQQLVILAGRPSMGKTALAANIAERVAVDCGETVLFMSLEMNQLELGTRLLFSRARVPHSKSRTGFLSLVERERLVATQAEVAQSKLYIDASASPTVSQIAAMARRIKRRHGLGLVVIDYLQLISPDNPKDPRQEQVAKIARSLKIMARSLNCPLLVLAQLNRQTEAASDHRPRLSHLRESGAIEQDADVVLFCHRDEYYATTDEEIAKSKGLADIIVSKHRNGPTGDVRMAWLAELMRFETLASKGTEFDAGAW